MKIILSPAKKMKVNEDGIDSRGQAVYLEKTKELLNWMKDKSYQELKEVWRCNDKIAKQNFERLKFMDLDKASTPAILSYDGIVYQYMGASVLEEDQLDYLQEHLSILSAFYGVLKPLDAVTPYRLEMQADAKINGCRNLYEFWGRDLYEALGNNSDRLIVNLASKEYSKCVEPYLKESDRYITCNFGELVNGCFKQKGTYAKMARGEMIRYMAEKEVRDVEEIKKFDRLNYTYSFEFSNDNEFYFIREV